MLEKKYIKICTTNLLFLKSQMAPSLHQVIHLQIRDAGMLLYGVVHEKATGDAEDERNPTDDIEGQLPAKVA